jgi:hypothetical protein
MPLFTLGMGIAKPSPARRTMHRGRIIARLIVRRYALTQSLQVFHRISPNAAILRVFDRKRAGKDQKHFLGVLAAQLAHQVHHNSNVHNQQRHLGNGYAPVNLNDLDRHQ